MANKRIEQLLLAAKTGNLDQAKEALEKGYESFWSEEHFPSADVNCEDVQGNTPLAIAAANGQGRAVDFLLEKGAKVSARNKAEKTPLMHAAANGHRDISARLIARDKGGVSLRNSDGKTALSCAAASAKAETVRLLLQEKSPVNDRDNAGMTALMHAAKAGDSVSVKLLLEAGGNVDECDANGNTALMHAAAGDKLAAFQALLEAGADHSIKNNSLKTAVELSQTNNFFAGPIEKLLEAFLKKNISAKENKPQQETAVAETAAVAPSSRAERLRAALEDEGLSPDTSEHWRPIGNAAIEQVLADTSSPKMLSTTFNFMARQYVISGKNLLTGEKDAPVSGSLESFPNKEMVTDAHRRLTEMGKNPPPYKGFSI